MHLHDDMLHGWRLPSQSLEEAAHMDHLVYIQRMVSMFKKLTRGAVDYMGPGVCTSQREVSTSSVVE